MRIVGKEPLFEGWGSYLRVTVQDDDGRRLDREVEHHGAAAGVLAYDPDRRVALLVRQLRVPMLLAGGTGETLEIAAGLIDGDEDADACIRREALEEIGLRLAAPERVVAVQTMPGVSTEIIHLYLAPYRAADRTGAGGGLAEEDEEIEVVEMPLAELAELADRGALPDAKTMLLVQTLRLRRPDLFGSPAGGASV